MGDPDYVLERSRLPAGCVTGWRQRDLAFGLLRAVVAEAEKRPGALSAALLARVRELLRVHGGG